MSASKRQIDANRKNAELSSGPKTLEGNDVSRGNSLKHGLSGEGVVATPDEARELDARMQAWRPSFKNELQGNDIRRELPFKQMVLNSIRMDHAQAREVEIHQTQRLHAFNNWESDRKLQAENLGATISKSPSLVVAKLENFLQGREWLIGRWTILKTRVQAGQPLGESHLGIIDDLLGVPHDFRTGATTIDDADAMSIVEGALERLGDESLERLRMLDAQDQAAAERGFEREISREERLNRRYEDLATKRFNVAKKELLAMGSAPATATANRPTPAPAIEPAAPTPKTPVSSLNPSASIEVKEESREQYRERMLRLMVLSANSNVLNEPNGGLDKMKGICVGQSATAQYIAKREAAACGRS